MTSDAIRCARLLAENRHLRETVQLLNTQVEAQQETIARLERDGAQRTEEALRESQAKLQSIFDSSPDAVTVTDLEGRITECNRAMLAMHGFSSREQVVGRSAFELIAATDHPRVTANMAVTFREGAVRNVPYMMCRADGTTFPAELSAGAIRGPSGEITGFTAIVKDITKRLRAIAALEQSEQCFRAVADYTCDLECWVGPDGRLRWLNPVVEQFTGYTVAECLAVPDFPIPVLHEEDKDRMVTLYRQAVAGSSGRDVECRLVHKNGTVTWMSASWQPIHAVDGTCLGCRFSYRDITERKRAEEDLLTHRRQLSALASELTLAEERERRRIAADLHDHACQDLVLARMNLQGLLAGAPSAGDAELRKIDGTLEHILESVRELTFDLSSPTLYKFGLAAALEELLEDKLGAEPDLEYEFWDDRVPKPLTEEVQVLLFRSVRELLVNTLKHARAHQVILDIRRVGDSIRIAVTDDGIGFDTDDVLSLPARHRGFGLFSIKERLDCIGGGLKIGSQRGAGSRFILVAPLTREGHDSGRKHDVGQDSVGG